MVYNVSVLLWHFTVLQIYSFIALRFYIFTALEFYTLVGWVVYFSSAFVLIICDVFQALTHMPDVSVSTVTLQCQPVLSLASFVDLPRSYLAFLYSFVLPEMNVVEWTCSKDRTSESETEQGDQVWLSRVSKGHCLVNTFHIAVNMAEDVLYSHWKMHIDGSILGGQSVNCCETVLLFYTCTILHFYRFTVLQPYIIFFSVLQSDHFTIFQFYNFWCRGPAQSLKQTCCRGFWHCMTHWYL